MNYAGETAYLVWLINKRTLGTNKPEYIETGLTIRKEKEKNLYSVLMVLLGKEEGWVGCFLVRSMLLNKLSHGVLLSRP